VYMNLEDDLLVCSRLLCEAHVCVGTCMARSVCSRGGAASVKIYVAFGGLLLGRLQ
jgi:hypothetical protein